MDSVDFIDIKSCRICLTTKKPLCPLFKYKLSGNYAEMLTAIADVKVSCSDGLPDKICGKCCTSLEKAFLLKTIAERSDRKMRKKLQKVQENKMKSTKKIAFNSITDIKSEIGPLAVKIEPKWETEIEVLVNENGINPAETVKGKDIVIANTIIRKVDQQSENNEKDNFFNELNESNDQWKSDAENQVLDDDDDVKDPDFCENDFFDDDDDDDYVPDTRAKSKPVKFKKPKLSEIKVFKDSPKKRVVKKIKVLRKADIVMQQRDSSDTLISEKPGQYITCYPIMRNGARGPPIILKRPKDSTILKVHPNYKPRKSSSLSSRTPRSPQSQEYGKSVKRLIRTSSPAPKQREKMVCPVCGILTYTLGNHMTTHQDKKKYPCSQCTRSFAQKSNLLVHLKQHSGVRDHICEICGAGFYCQKSLIRHNLIHKGDRPYACTLCSKTFIARCDLNRHLRIHSGYKPFKCNTCTMSFNAKHQLQNHERMHTGERPYTCQVCNVAFSYKVNLNNHVQKVHGINLKFKSIHTVTEDILRKEQEMSGETRAAVAHIIPSSITSLSTAGNSHTSPMQHDTITHQVHYI